MTSEEINTLENKVFRFECEKIAWRRFRTIVEKVVEMQTTFGKNTEEEIQTLKNELESIKYY